MAIKVNGTTVVDNSRNLTNVESATFTGVGYIKVPSGTQVQRPGSPAEGMIRYNTDLDSFEGFTNGAWGSIGGGATGSAGDTVFFENSQTVNTSYTITTNKNAMTTGPVSIADGVAVTIPDGSRWVIL